MAASNVDAFVARAYLMARRQIPRDAYLKFGLVLNLITLIHLEHIKQLMEKLQHHINRMI